MPQSASPLSVAGGMIEPVTGSAFDFQTLRESIRPMRLHYYPHLRSTNDEAAELRRRGDLFAPAMVLTANQTAGRGRGGNVWWSNESVITVTFAMPVEEHLAPHHLPLVAGLAVRNAAAELAGIPGIQLKWPNDVMYDGRKLAGLLCERMLKVDLIGVGLNLNLDCAEVPRELRRRVTSLSTIAGRAFDRTEALTRITRHLLTMLSRRSDTPVAGLLQEYDRHHALVGQRVVVINEERIEGVCEGLDSVGRLVLKEAGRVHRVVSGSVGILDAEP